MRRADRSRSGKGWVPELHYLSFGQPSTADPAMEAEPSRGMLTETPSLVRGTETR